MSFFEGSAHVHDGGGRSKGLALFEKLPCRVEHACVAHAARQAANVLRVEVREAVELEDARDRRDVRARGCRETDFERAGLRPLVDQAVRVCVDARQDGLEASRCSRELGPGQGKFCFSQERLGRGSSATQRSEQKRDAGEDAIGGADHGAEPRARTFAPSGCWHQLGEGSLRLGDPERNTPRAASVQAARGACVSTVRVFSCCRRSRVPRAS